MNTIAITAASIVTPFTQNPKKPQPKQQTAKEAIAANVQALIEQLEQGHSADSKSAEGNLVGVRPPPGTKQLSAFQCI